MKKILKKIVATVYPSLLYASKSYSQDGEDMLLKAFYEGRKDYKGFYVDIGAHHPYRFSNTAYFYERGWSGINIEPTPALIKAFHRERKRDINLNIGISDSEERMTFYEFNESALNTFDKNRALSVENEQYKIIAQTEIEVRTLQQVLAQYLPQNQHIDFMNIDVEGLDLSVLLSNDWSIYSPDYILVEGKFSIDQLNNNEIYVFLKRKNYTLAGRTKRTFLFKFEGKRTK